jgi:hypothetical protein
MKILNGSIADLADTFLHAGYLSAYREVTVPGPVTAAIVPVDKAPILQVDMAEALRLTPAMQQVMGAATGPRPQEPATPAFPWVVLLVAMLLWTRGRRLVGACRDRLAPRRQGWSPRAVGVVAALGLAVAAACSHEPGPDAAGAMAERPPSAPASAAALASAGAVFEDPRAATVALLNGVIADALACSQSTSITSLEDVRSQVGLPAASKTAGMRWAVANFEQDGWGRPFRLREAAKDRFEVRSAAEDGAFDTADDLSLEVKRVGASLDWPRQLRAFYLRRERDDAGVSFHRCGPRGGETRRVPVEPTARGLYGDGLFGVIREQQFAEGKRQALRARIERVSGSRDRDALVLAVYDPKHVGRLGTETVLVPAW